MSEQTRDNAWRHRPDFQESADEAFGHSGECRASAPKMAHSEHDFRTWWGGLSMRAEHLYVDLSSVADNFNVYALSIFGQTGSRAANRSITSNVKEHIGRLGVNYKLGGLGTD